jgi:hypothetical protein
MKQLSRQNNFMYFFGSWKGWIHVFSSLYIMHVNYDTDFVTFSPTVCMEVGSGSGVCILPGSKKIHKIILS